MLHNPHYEKIVQDNMSLTNLTQDDDDSTEVEEIDNKDNLEQDIDSQTIKIDDRDKEGSKWVILDNIYMSQR